MVLTPARVRRARSQQDVWEVFVEWEGLSPDDATWEPRESFAERYPDFQLEDKLFQQAGRDVMTSITYARRRPISG